ncbi:MAG: isoprenylcysteine carboxylmethyltransferase family protein [Acidobacteriaceae bacterium]
MKTNITTLIVLFLVIVTVALHDPHITLSPEKVIGAVIAGISLPLFITARLQLGRSFSVQAKARALVTTGLYSRFRNPIYLFGGLVVAGASTFTSVWGPLVVAAVLIPLQLVRVRKEEEVLTQAFGEEYLRYREKTWF